MQGRKFVWAAVLVAAVVTAVAGSATAAEKRSKAVTLNLVAYSTPRPVVTKLIEEFRKTPAGSDINIRASYGPSSAQGQAVANGLPADGVILNTGNDINDLVDKGLISKNWDKQSYNGVVWNSVVVYGLRNGNPKKIKGWNDLVKPGVQAVTVNPFTGGIAKWNILAAYVAQRRIGRTEKQALDYLRKFYRNNVVSQDSSGSNATNTFLSGKGDVLLTFESEAINGKIPFVIPRQTMLIDVYIAAIEKSEHKAEWNAFSRYLKTYPATEDPGRERLSAGQQAGAHRVPAQVPRPGRRDEDHAPAPRRLARRRQEVVRPEEEHHAADRIVARGAHWRLAPSSRRRASRRPARIAGGGPHRPSPCKSGSSRASCSSSSCSRSRLSCGSRRATAGQASGRSSRPRRPLRR